MYVYDIAKVIEYSRRNVINRGKVADLHKLYFDNLMKVMSGKQPVRVIYRKADDGKITTKSYAESHPKTTVKETMKIPKKSK